MIAYFKEEWISSKMRLNCLLSKLSNSSPRLDELHYAIAYKAEAIGLASDFAIILLRAIGPWSY